MNRRKVLCFGMAVFVATLLLATCDLSAADGEEDTSGNPPAQDQTNSASAGHSWSRPLQYSDSDTFTPGIVGLCTQDVRPPYVQDITCQATGVHAMVVGENVVVSFRYTVQNRDNPTRAQLLVGEGRGDGILRVVKVIYDGVPGTKGVTGKATVRLPSSYFDYPPFLPGTEHWPTTDNKVELVAMCAESADAAIQVYLGQAPFIPWVFGSIVRIEYQHAPITRY